MSNKILSLKNLSVEYQGKYAVKEVSADFEKNKNYAILGESGAGKSTLLMAIAGLLKPQAQVSGEICFYGEEGQVRKQEEMYPKKMGVIFQNPYTSFDLRKTIGYQFHEMLSYQGIKSKKNRKELIESSLESLGFQDLQALVKKYPFELSGGMQQRISIAMASIFNPNLLLADEPTASLDTLNQTKVLDALMDIREEKNFTLLLVTHDIALASHYADEILILKNGHLVEANTTKEIVLGAREDYTKELLKAALEK